MPRKRPSARSKASFLESLRSVLTLSFAATATDAGLTTMLVMPAFVSERWSTNAENPASYTEESLAPWNHRGKLAARLAGSAWTVAVFTIRLLCMHVTAYGSPIFKAVPKKRCKALYRALKKSPKSPELAVGAGSEPSYVDRSVGAP